MSASIFRLLADELDISEQNAKKLLSAMLREVKKRAHKGGVRLPDFGKFKEHNGQLTFEPSESLARAVNHRFEGLSSEDLKDAPGQEKEEEKEDTGPSTITLGYQDSGWSPLDSAEESESDEAKEEDDGADTEEFTVPDAESAADTDELNVGTPEPEASTEPIHEEPAQNQSSEPDSSSETEELYPLVEDEPEEQERTDASPSSGRTSSDEDAEREHLSGIWSSEPEESAETTESTETGGAALDDIPTEPDAFDKDPPSETPDSDSPETTTESTVDESTRADRAPTTSASSGSSGSRILVSFLVLLLLGGGAWYILGQRGAVPRPGPALADLQTQAQSVSAQLFGSGASGSDTTTTAAQNATNATAATTSGETTSSTDDDGTSSTQSADQQDSSSSTSGIDQSAGGWSIIVASRTDRTAASSLADTYRERFAGQRVPVDVIPGNVNNSTRFRVGVGQFSSRTEAQGFLSKFGSKLPDGAWALRLQ